MNNYYEDLNIENTATIELIQQAYKKLALKYHPDRNLNDVDEAKKKFQIVNAAYEILSDQRKRAEYDLKGYVGRRPNNYQPKPSKSKVKTKEDFEKEFREEKKKEEVKSNTYKDEPMNISCSFFGDGKIQGRSILVHLKLSDDELRKGVLKNFLIKKRDFCNFCGGVVFDYFQCQKCFDNLKYKHLCTYCNGKNNLSNCPECSGTGFGDWVIDELSYKIPPNSQRGSQLNIFGAGEVCHNKPPGNVRIFLV